MATMALTNITRAFPETRGSWVCNVPLGTKVRYYDTRRGLKGTYRSGVVVDSRGYDHDELMRYVETLTVRWDDGTRTTVSDTSRTLSSLYVEP